MGDSKHWPIWLWRQRHRPAHPEVGRWIALDERDDGRLQAFTTFLLFSEALQATLWARLPSRGAPSSAWLPIVLALISIACLFIPVRDRSNRSAGAGIMTLVTLFHIVAYFPTAPNHSYLGFFCLLLITLSNTQTQEGRKLALSTLCIVALIVLFYSGVQKLLYGLYARGQYLAFEFRDHSHLHAGMALVLPAEELQYVRDLPPPAPNSGPYRFKTTAGLLLANLTVCLELLLPLLLALRKTRMIGLWASTLFVVTIELVAREIIFGLLFIQLLALFAPTNWNKRLLPLTLAIYGAMLVARLGWIPPWYFN